MAGAGLLPLGAQAASLGDLFPPKKASCFVATYDGAHLARNPKQAVVAIRVVTVPEHASADGTADMVMLDLDITLRGRKQPFRAVGLNCFREDGDAWRCQERVCNPRNIEVKAESADTLLLDLHQRNGDQLKPGGLMLRSECGAADVERVTKLTLGSADQTFKLQRMSAAACR